VTARPRLRQLVTNPYGKKSCRTIRLKSVAGSEKRTGSTNVPSPDLPSRPIAPSTHPAHAAVACLAVFRTKAMVQRGVRSESIDYARAGGARANGAASAPVAPASVCPASARLPMTEISRPVCIKVVVALASCGAQACRLTCERLNIG
jgi:hypothetical protein